MNGKGYVSAGVVKGARDMSADEVRSDPDNKDSRQPYAVRLPGFITEEEVGLGDVIKRATSTVGIRSCGSCNQRAAALNR
jgi:hypothetical protein